MIKSPYFYAGVSIFCWSTVATTCKFLLKDLNNLQLLWVNALVAGVFLLIINLVSGNFRKYKEYKLKDYLVMAVIGLPSTFLYYMFYYAGTDILDASQAFIINYLWPIMSVVFACIILKEKLTARKVIAILVSFGGLVIVVGGSMGQLDGAMIWGAVCCILGAVSYGLFTALNQKMNYNKSMTLMVSYFASFILTTIINMVNGELFVPTMGQLPGFLWNGIFAIAVANTFWVIALGKGKTAKISNLAYITPFLSLVWTSVFLGEDIEINSIIGLLVIVAGVLIQLKDKDGKTEQKRS